MKTVYCPVKKGRINGTDCMIVCDVADDMVKETVLPEGIIWNENQQKECLNCKYHYATEPDEDVLEN